MGEWSVGRTWGGGGLLHDATPVVTFITLQSVESDAELRKNLWYPSVFVSHNFKNNKILIIILKNSCKFSAKYFIEQNSRCSKRQQEVFPLLQFTLWKCCPRRLTPCSSYSLLSLLRCRIRTLGSRVCFRLTVTQLLR